MRLQAAVCLVLVALAPVSSASALTIDFEDFALGPLPATYATPWGDIEFRSGFVRDNPLGPGAKMAYGFEVPDGDLEGEIGPLFLMFPTAAQSFEVTFTFVNLNPEPRSLEGAEVDASGSDLNDFGVTLPAQGSATATFTFVGGEDDPSGIYFLGVVADLTESDRCFDQSTTCNGLWGLDSFTVEAVPEPSTALLLGLGMLGMVKVRSRA